MNKTIRVFFQNGDAGAGLMLPASRDDFQKTMREIGATDVNDLTVGRYETDMTTLPADILMKADLNHVNYLAARLAGTDEKQLAMLNAIMESPFRLTTVEQLIDYADNEDYFLFRPGINDAAALGRYYVFDTGLCQMPEEWKDGIDLEKFGEHAARQERGEFTSKGYLMPSGDEWQNKLAENGIPGEYRIYHHGK